MAIYKCGYCGKEYGNIKDRAQCELACARKEELKAEEEKKRKLAAEKETRAKVIQKLAEEATTLLEKYEEDYDEIPDFLVDTPIDTYHRLKKFTEHMFDF